ncbi:hypothetical protein [Halalkalibacter alkalisediminis]|uniref:Uncharacterized protein n=1 Tax=Halalkalibacter alkalisediminis TaxID=935616 RepID=A0ABV6NNY3_9BACI|nr:hypothetical protein [Halalkalibacter alkalisediminis]
MSKRDKDDYVSKIDTDDGWNRAFYGSPTKDGCLVFILVIIFIFWLMK